MQFCLPPAQGIGRHGRDRHGDEGGDAGHQHAVAESAYQGTCPDYFRVIFPLKFSGKTESWVNDGVI